ncbi:hypothetical protein JCM10213_000279 [Rhodosporidiobolus nylandii]
MSSDAPVLSVSPSTPFPLTRPSPGSPLASSSVPQNAALPRVFQPFAIRSIAFANRIFLSPMCQYSAASEGSEAGCANRWHTTHLEGFAARGAGLVMTEAVAVQKDGRLSPQDLGLWNDKQRDALKPIVEAIHAHGSKAGIQIGHAGRKSSTLPPWLATSPGDSHVAQADFGGWPDKVVGASAVAYHAETYPHPKEMSVEEIATLKEDWVSAIKRADEAGFDVLELHFAHGYLVHNMLSPLSNQRDDEYGGSLENRLRLPLSLIALSRAAWSAHKPLFVRISATEWHPSGEGSEEEGWKSWGLEQSKVLVREAVKLGVDLVDVSSGGNAPDQEIKPGPLYQVPLASAIRSAIHDIDYKAGDENPHGVAALVSAVGLITTADQAESVLQAGQADVITVGRQFLRDPCLVFTWAQDLGVAVSAPVQYQRAFTRMLKKKVPRDDQQCHHDLHHHLEEGEREQEKGK